MTIRGRSSISDSTKRKILRQITCSIFTFVQYVFKNETAVKFINFPSSKTMWAKPRKLDSDVE